MEKITDARIAELVVKNVASLTLDESEELIWLLHDKLKELNALERYQSKRGIKEVGSSQSVKEV
jgi:hypothetical protein